MGFYSISIAIAASNFLLTAVLLFLLKKARNVTANRLLGFLLLLLGASFISDILWTSNFFQRYPHFFEYDTPIGLCLGPLLFFYIRCQINPKAGLHLSDLLHLTPLVLYVWLLNDFLFESAYGKLEMINNRSIPNLQFVQYLKKAQLLIYGLLCYRLLMRHKRITRDLLSNLESRQLLWVQQLLVGAGLLFGIWVVSDESNRSQLMLGFTLLTFSYWIAYQALQQESSFAHIATETVLPIIEEEPAVRYRNSSFTEEHLQTAIKEIESYMSERKPYLDGDLTLTSLAKQLNINPNQLSQILNEGLNENFYRYINRYRVKESKLLLINPAFAHFNILGIAYQAGFSTKSTFTRHLKSTPAFLLLNI
ncbi:MAG TPA: helix-turn-helix domain-containing protein [Pedobacter sp.]|jgi:AraC-like DNA-binding protein